MVLLVHGGPWGRDTWGQNSTAQWLANRGYAVLQVNFRASTGFGKKFLNAGNRQWGLAMHDDLLDAVAWAVKEGVADPKKVAIMGGSYGGYATLAGLAFTPDTFACGVDIVGPSNLFTLLATIPPYWAAFRRQLVMRIGDPDDAQDKEMLTRASPLFSADKIKVPLLIGQGANDPRVKPAESEQIVAAMEKNGLPVTYVLYPDEGHGFARPENRIDFFARVRSFPGEVPGGARRAAAEGREDRRLDRAGEGGRGEEAVKSSLPMILRALLCLAVLLAACGAPNKPLTEQQICGDGGCDVCIGFTCSADAGP